MQSKAKRQPHQIFIFKFNYNRRKWSIIVVMSPPNNWPQTQSNKPFLLHLSRLANALELYCCSGEFTTFLAEFQTAHCTKFTDDEDQPLM